MQNSLQRQLIPTESPSISTERMGTPLQRLTARALGMRRKAATVVLAALSLALGVYAIFGHDGLVAYQQKQRRAAQLQQQILTMKNENDRMAAHARRLQTDQNTIEYEAREQMHYTRPGEVIYTLPQAPGTTQPKSKQ